MTGVRGKCRHVDEPDDLRLGSRLRDHHPAVRMSHENDRAILKRDGAFCGRHVIGERRERILNGHDIETGLLDVDPGPVGGIARRLAVIDRQCDRF